MATILRILLNSFVHGDTSISPSLSYHDLPCGAKSQREPIPGDECESFVWFHRKGGTLVIVVHNV